jgi:prepilin-type N-terminal cleavage/methylation domain-containing protein
MKGFGCKRNYDAIEAKQGFSLVEVMVASSVSVLVIGMVMTCFIWCAKNTSICMKRGWTQADAVQSSTKIITYMRNASFIYDIDDSGDWIVLCFPSGRLFKMSYLNPTDDLRDGNMHLFEVDSDGDSLGSDESIVLSGMMAIPAAEGEGYSEHVFSGTVGGANVKVAYRISSPSADGTRAADDSKYAVSMRFGVYLRNAGTTTTES